MGRIAALGFALFCYAAFLVSMLYFVGFLQGWFVPKAINDGAIVDLERAIFIDCGLIAIFALQHSVMARPEFKEWWTQIVPPAIERSVYVLFSSAVLGFLMWQWAPIPGVIWSVESASGRVVLNGLYLLGFGWAFMATFMISHTELLGLKQACRHFTGRRMPQARLVEPLFYRWVRHPMMFGFIVAFWATPEMTGGRMIFAGLMTLYILAAIQLEERDLLDELGDSYDDYRRRVSMIIPLPPERDD